MERNREVGLFVLFAVLLFAFAYYFIYASSTPVPPSRNYDEFAQCLTEKGIKMYGSGWCSHCNDQKNLFGSSFDYVDSKDCDAVRSECIAAGVKYYPTWVINGIKYTGAKSIQELSSLSGCELE
jgi:hypothetical protein